jgi:hypothetical protein
LLDGHTITYPFSSSGVTCADQTGGGTCTVEGPGAVVGGQGVAISGGRMNVIAKRLSIAGAFSAILTEESIRVEDVTIANGEDGQIRAGKGIRATRVTPGPGGMTAGGNIAPNGATLKTYSGPVGTRRQLRGRDLSIETNARLNARDVFLRRVSALLPGRRPQARGFSPSRRSEASTCAMQTSPAMPQPSSTRAGHRTWYVPRAISRSRTTTSRTAGESARTTEPRVAGAVRGAVLRAVEKQSGPPKKALTKGVD